MNVQQTQKAMGILLLSIFLLAWPAGAPANNVHEEKPGFSQEEIAQMLAPVALYPDPLLSQVLIAAAYPFEIIEADRWIAANSHLAGDALDRALLNKDWDVSILSLCHYPRVLAMMSENISWTANLGNAFVYQQDEVMDTIQDLRLRASASGNLVTTTEQRVIVEERIVRIVPVYPTYIHVPVYDPFFVYGTWWYPAYPPVRVYYPGVTVVGPRVTFSAGIHVGFGVIGWSVFDWPSRNVVIVNINHTKRFNRNYHVYHAPQKVSWKPVPERRLIRTVPFDRGTSFSAPSRHDRYVAPPLRITDARKSPAPRSIERQPTPARTPDRTAFSRDRSGSTETRTMPGPISAAISSTAPESMAGPVPRTRPGGGRHDTVTRPPLPLRDEGSATQRSITERRETIPDRGFLNRDRAPAVQARSTERRFEAATPRTSPTGRTTPATVQSGTTDGGRNSVNRASKPPASTRAENASVQKNSGRNPVRFDIPSVSTQGRGNDSRLGKIGQMNR